MIKQLSILVILCIVFTSCEYFDRIKERGNGKTTTQSRSEKDFRGVRTYGSFDVELTTSNDYSVKIETDENLLQYIETRVEDGRLVISTKKGVSVDPTSRLKAYVSAPQFHDISASGSGNVTATNELVSDDDMHLGISGSGNINAHIKAKDVDVDISGNGDMILEGTATTFKSSIAGSGNIKAGKLVSENVSIDIAGSGDAQVSASKKLDVSIAGSGDVIYEGNPSISQHVAGSGNIRHKE